MDTFLLPRFWLVMSTKSLKCCPPFFDALHPVEKDHYGNHNASELFIDPKFFRLFECIRIFHPFRICSTSFANKNINMDL